MSDNNLDQLFKENLQGFEVPYNEGAWTKAEELINASETGNRRRLFWPLIFAGIIGIVGTTGGLIFNFNNSSNSYSPSTKNELPINPKKSSLEPKQNKVSSIPASKKNPKEKITPARTSSAITETRSTSTFLPKTSAIILPVEQEEDPLDYGATVSTGQGFTDFSPEYVFGRKAKPKPLDVASDHSENKEINPLKYIGYRVDLVGGLIPLLGTSSESGGLDPIPFYAGANFINYSISKI